MGNRHPTWFPLFYNKRGIDFSTNISVRKICREQRGENWLRDLTPKLLDYKDINNASSALAEIRAYGGLLAAGFKVAPIPRKDDSTPDFNISGSQGEMTVEVFSKHQDKQQDHLLFAAHSRTIPSPQGVELNSRVYNNTIVDTAIIELTPAGRPDPNKLGDSVQSNMISRVCSIKQNERQIPEDRPALLIMDFCNFGGPHVAEFLKSGQAAPIECGQLGITSGSFWYAMYGWKDAPIFEEGRKVVKMAHEGRFRQVAEKKSKLSAALLVLSEHVILFENPWATHRLPMETRMQLCRYPCFDMLPSIADWNLGDAENLVAIQRRMIESMAGNYSLLNYPYE
jgi:hypothetical protein